VDFDRLKAGPSYIELGAWLGDQHTALIVMALGEHHGLWKVITPATLKSEGEEADTLAGLGYVMISLTNAGLEELS
jgi:hypothetical protein